MSKSQSRLAIHQESSSEDAESAGSWAVMGDVFSFGSDSSPSQFRLVEDLAHAPSDSQPKTCLTPKRKQTQFQPNRKESGRGKDGTEAEQRPDALTVSGAAFTSPCLLKRQETLPMSTWLVDPDAVERPVGAT